MLSDSRRFMSDLEGQVTKMTKSGAMHRKIRTASVRAATWADAVAAPITMKYVGCEIDWGLKGQIRHSPISSTEVLSHS